MKKRMISFVLALVVILSLCPQLVMPAEAATSNAVAQQVSKNLPIVTYAMPLSGKSRVYSYSNSSLSKITTGYFIDTFKDEIVITQISNNGKAVYVSYPSTSARSGYRSRWFAADDILGLASVSIFNGKASQKTTAYRMRNAKAVISWGSVFKNDAYTQLGKHAVNGINYNVTIYPISSTTVNGVSGIKHKMALANVSAIQNGSQSQPTQNSVSSGWQWPMSSYRVSQAFNRKRSSGVRRYHCGIDIVASDKKVYAAASGKVVYKGYSSDNGNHVVISHNLNGKTVKTLYSHLANFNKCPDAGQPVNKGAQIGVMGSTGNSTGEHLHFAIYTGATNDPWGYAYVSGSNKMDFKKNNTGPVVCTFYNPSYVISNGRLP